MERVDVGSRPCSVRSTSQPPGGGAKDERTCDWCACEGREEAWKEVERQGTSQRKTSEAVESTGGAERSS